jgi:hypothetical protein
MSAYKEFIRCDVTDYSVNIICKLLTATPSACHSHSTFPSYVDRAFGQLQSLMTADPTGPAFAGLVHLLGDADAVADASAIPHTPCSIYRLFMQMTHPTLLLLLQSEVLKARSENTIVLLANEWVSHPVGASCTIPQLRLVAESIRLGAVSQAYLFDVVRRLPWMQLTFEEHFQVVRFSTASRNMQHSLVNDRSFLPDQPAWLQSTRTVDYVDLTGDTETSIDPRTLQWSFTQSSFDEALQKPGTQDRTLLSPFSVVNGFMMRPFFIMSPGKNAKVFLEVRVSQGISQRLVGQLLARIQLSVTCTISGAAYHFTHSEALTPNHCLYFCSLLPLPGSSWSAFASWKKFFVDGVCTVQIVISDIA